MEKMLFQDCNQSERIQLLKDNADTIEPLGYQKPLTEDQITTLKQDLTEISIKIADIEFAKSEATHSFNQDLKPLKKKRAEVVEVLKNRSEFKDEDCFKFVDQEAGEVGYYNEEGILVYQRTILPTERQKTLFATMPARQKTGTDN